MDTQRFILILALALVSMMLWQEWQQDYGSTSAGSGDRQAAAPAEDPGIPQMKPDEVAGPDFPDAESATAADPAIVTVETDVLRLKIDQGGTIVYAELPDYPVSLDRKDQAFVLLDNSADLYHVIQGGIVGEAAPTHKDTFSATQQSYTLGTGEQTLEVPLSWTSAEGVSVTKVFVFERGSYQVHIKYLVENGAGAAWEGRQYTQIKRDDPSREGRRLIYTYTGAVLSGPDDPYDKISFGDMEDKDADAQISNGWAAMIQHYFLSAILPSDIESTYRYYTRTFSARYYSIGSVSPTLRLDPGQRGELSGYIYIGPKVQSVLDTLADNLELTVDYGMLWFLAKPLFWCLERLHGLTGNWGWSIILVTILLKLVFYHLSAAGYRSMANMRRVQPRLMALRERHKDDRARLNQAMMQIYKEEKINPFGGYFPILVQIPVFVALYWVLLESVELRQADFIFWLKDLSSKDPFYVLPILMGATMLIQQKLNPAPMDPMQEKVMKALPFVFTIFFAFFPSGLVLYWVTNNVLSIAQQWLIMRNLEKEGLSSTK